MHEYASDDQKSLCDSRSSRFDECIIIYIYII